MFGIELHKSLPADKALLDEKGATLEGAIDFISTFTFDGGILTSNWMVHEGRYVVDVYDWCECWFDNPPRLARITAPSGFVPPVH